MRSRPEEDRRKRRLCRSSAWLRRHEGQKRHQPLKGHFGKADVAPKRHLREFKFDSADDMNIGDIVKVDVFAAGDHIDVTGISKGKGYAGTIKRWNFHRLKESHGTGPVARHAGSNGACSSPSRVFKGKKLPGIWAPSESPFRISMS